MHFPCIVTFIFGLYIIGIQATPYSSSPQLSKPSILHSRSDSGIARRVDYVSNDIRISTIISQAATFYFRNDALVVLFGKQNSNPSSSPANASTSTPARFFTWTRFDAAETEVYILNETRPRINPFTFSFTDNLDTGIAQARAHGEIELAVVVHTPREWAFARLVRIALLDRVWSDLPVKYIQTPNLDGGGTHHVDLTIDPNTLEIVERRIAEREGVGGYIGRTVTHQLDPGIDDLPEGFVLPDDRGY